MGVYIKGMEMPKNCFDCPLNYDSIDCMVADIALREKGGGDFLYEHERASHCPLVPVPPHGRLIDADALKLSHCKECTLYPDKCLEKTDEGCDWGSIYHIEHCAPTIIEAEEGE